MLYREPKQLRTLMRVMVSNAGLEWDPAYEELLEDGAGKGSIPVFEILLSTPEATLEFLFRWLDMEFGELFTRDLRSTIKGGPNYYRIGDGTWVDRPTLRVRRVAFKREDPMKDSDLPGLGLLPIFFTLEHPDRVRSIGPEQPYWWVPDFRCYVPCEGLDSYPVITRNVLGPVIVVDYKPSVRDQHRILSRLVEV